MLICASSASTGSPCVRSCASDCPPACKARCSPWPTSSSKPPSTVSAPLSWPPPAPRSTSKSSPTTCSTRSARPAPPSPGKTMEPNGSDAASACLASAFWRISSPPRPPSPSCCSSAIVCWRCSMRHRRSFPSATPDSSWCSPPTRSACCTRSCPDICAASASHWCRRCSP